jgi:hypothetical protein
MHTLVTIGCLGMKRAYLDVPRDEAIRRFKVAEGYEPPDGEVDEFLFHEEFYTYEAGRIEESGLAPLPKADNTRHGY